MSSVPGAAASSTAPTSKGSVVPGAARHSSAWSASPAGSSWKPRPAGLDPDQIGAALAARPHVAEVHDLHIWEITSGQPALSAHVLVQPGQDCHAVRDDLAALLAAEHHIDHVTLQVDHAAAVLDITDRATAEHCEEPHGRVHRPDNSPA